MVVRIGSACGTMTMRARVVGLIIVISVPMGLVAGLLGAGGGIAATKKACTRGPQTHQEKRQD